MIYILITANPASGVIWSLKHFRVMFVGLIFSEKQKKHNFLSSCELTDPHHQYTVDEKNPAPVDMVVYPIVYWVLYIQTVVGLGISSIN